MISYIKIFICVYDLDLIESIKADKINPEFKLQIYSLM